MVDKKEADWDAIELDYRAGVLPLTAIVKKHGVSMHVLRSTAEKFMWERKPLDPLKMQQAHGVASSAPTGAKFGMDSSLNEKDLSTAAILTAASVIEVHRKDVKQLRELSSKFSDALANLFVSLKEQEKHPDMLESCAAALSALIGKDTPIDMLDKLSRVMVRLVTIERQAFGLDVMPNPDPGADNGDAAKSEVAKLWEQVKELQKEKTASIH